MTISVDRLLISRAQRRLKAFLRRRAALLAEVASEQKELESLYGVRPVRRLIKLAKQNGGPKLRRGKAKQNKARTTYRKRGQLSCASTKEPVLEVLRSLSGTFTRDDVVATLKREGIRVAPNYVTLALGWIEGIKKVGTEPNGRGGQPLNVYQVVDAKTLRLRPKKQRAAAKRK